MLYDATRQLEARGFTIFTPKNSAPYQVKAIGTLIRISQFPFTTWATLAGVTLDSGIGMVHMETCVKGATQNSDGSITTFESYPVLMIQTGVLRAVMWDGTTVTTLNPITGGTPIGTWMKWVGDRLWLISGNQVYSSNLLAPDQFLNDGSTLAGAGYFTLPGLGTGLGVTADQNSLIAFTDDTTSAFQSGILDRSTWLSTSDFQKVILLGIGCIAGRTIVSQWGMLWWLSQGGLIGLDDALTAFRSSRIHYSDGEMARSRINFSNDMSAACAGAFENFLMISVPSGDAYNAHTWVMDQGIMSQINSEAPAAWASCWTGTFPVQWVTKMINGKLRCFHFSRGRIPQQSTNGPVSDVWESFSRLRKDVTYNINGTRSLLEIAWSTEFKYLSNDSRFKLFDFFEVMLVQIARTVTISGSYAPRHGGYKEVLTVTLQSDVDNMGLGETLLTTTSIAQRVMQTRRVRSRSDTARLTDSDNTIEDVYTRNKDRGFFILLSGTGECAIHSLTLYTTIAADQLDGRIEVNEATLQYVLSSGGGTTTTGSPAVPTVSVLPQSAVPFVFIPRSPELTYSSL